MNDTERIIWYNHFLIYGCYKLSTTLLNSLVHWTTPLSYHMFKRFHILLSKNNINIFITMIRLVIYCGTRQMHLYVDSRN